MPIEPIRSGMGPSIALWRPKAIQRHGVEHSVQSAAFIGATGDHPARLPLSSRQRRAVHAVHSRRAAGPCRRRGREARRPPDPNMGNTGKRLAGTVWRFSDGVFDQLGFPYIGPRLEVLRISRRR